MKQREGYFLSNCSSSEGRADRPGRAGPVRVQDPLSLLSQNPPPLSLSGHAELIILKYCQHAVKIMSNENKEK